jgi:uncharacterized protein (DUF58 family)
LSAAIGEAARLFALATPRRLRGSSGSVETDAPGASGEFQDRRTYAWGDDLRHLDWAALARTDQHLVRVHRAEVTPSVEVFLDRSASMGSEPAKWARTLEIVELTLHLARQDGLRARLQICGEERTIMEAEHEELWRGLEPTGRQGLEVLAEDPPPPRPGSVRILLSDLLFPVPAAAILRPLRRGAALTSVVQVLAPEEAAPTLQGGHRLIDVEGEEALDVVLDEASLRAYRERLDALVAEWRREVRRSGGGEGLATVPSDQTLLQAAAGPLLRAGLLVPRS